mmetsp:Transcript_75198/g.220447  ORF Transcript_75198/g.220447 Transcript_75198/m.220447 type:complete len:443 (-) Transcript_75198:13-1341(-)
MEVEAQRPCRRLASDFAAVVECPESQDVRIQQMGLCYAASEGDIEEIQRLLNSGVDPNLRDYDLRSAMHVAASHGQIEAVKALLECGASPNVKDHIGVTPLYEAQNRGHPQIEKVLREGGAKLSQVRLRDKAIRENWAIAKEDVKLADLLSETIKSQVFKGQWRGIQVVAKFAKVQSEEGQDEEEAAADNEAIRIELLHEIELLASLRHPDLVLFLGASLQDPKVMFITECMDGGDLERYFLRKRQDSGVNYRPSLNQLLRWANAVARALSFLHGCRNPIIHRDLKPLNLLLTKHHRDVKVADFGISKMTRRKSSKAFKTKDAALEHFKMTGGIGSWRYMAPEVVRHEDYNEKVDIFSFALILFFMSSGKDPFYEKRQADWMLQEYLQGNEPRPREAECHKPLRELMAAAWHPSSEKRPSAAEMVGSLADISMTSKCGCTSM